MYRGYVSHTYNFTVHKHPDRNVILTTKLLLLHEINNILMCINLYSARQRWSPGVNVRSEWKCKYVPEMTDFDDDRTQCPDDNDIFVSEMCSQPLDYQHEDKTKFKDSSTCPENKTNMLSTPSVIDGHGCNYFGQLVSNELVRFDTKKIYKIMQKMLEILHNEKWKQKNDWTVIILIKRIFDWTVIILIIKWIWLNCDNSNC